MKIYLLLGHPDKKSLNGQIAEAYYKAAIEKGHEVRFQQLGEMTFEPILWKGYKAIQELEPDLKQAQQNITWCDKWVIVFPMWWGSVPALLKGFIDRTLHPGFAFKYHDHGPLWDKLLKGRSAELISTCDGPWWWNWLQYRNCDLTALKMATLKFCGVSPVRSTRISSVLYLDNKALQNKIRKICAEIKTT
jgi:NAD(P)H dehydrogenase (quinone)